MTGASGMSSGDAPDPRTPDTDRPWQHPSEVGLAVRGRTDRRRSTVIAAGVLLSGIGLLVSGILLGSMRHDEPTSEDEDLAERMEASIANVMVVDDDSPTMVTGLVMDDQGHVLVRADAIGGADELWARCHEGRLQEATLVGLDEQANIAVLKLDSPAGRPPTMSGEVPSEGLDVVAVGAVDGAMLTHDGTIGADDVSTSNDMFHTEMASDSAMSDGVVFDSAGDLLGVAMTPPPDAEAAPAPHRQDEITVPVRTAGATMAIARRLIA